MKKYVSILFSITLFTLLALLTQVGALSYLLSKIMAKSLKVKKISHRTALNFTLYGIFTIIITPLIAPIFGREAITNHDGLKPLNYWVTVGMNRNYVIPELNDLLQKVSEDISAQQRGITLYYLDAGFPFFNHYPLLPHLSHHDGRKVDLSYFYEDTEGKIINEKPSNSGYGVFEEPLSNESNTTEICKNKGYFQYDYPKFLTLGKSDLNMVFSEKWNNILLNSILVHKKVTKVFIEPHLVKRLRLTDYRIRFHGCRAVRHDDHIHIQI